MVRVLLWLAVGVGYVVLVWHGVTGDTGPMGWLNALQQQWSGGYSRKLSFVLLMLGVTVLASPVLLPLLLMGDPPPKPRPADAAAPAAPPRPGWQVALLAWVVPVALAWAGSLAWHAWDWWQQARDASAAFEPVSLASEAPLAAGQRVTLQGRLLWDRSVVRRDRGHSPPESTFVPVVDAGWRPGDPVRLVLQFDGADALAARRAAPAALRVRVQGAVPSAAAGVFAQGGAPLAPQAALGVQAAPPAVTPPFPVQGTVIVGGVLSAIWTLVVVAIGGALAREAWGRRRAARTGAGT